MTGEVGYDSMTFIGFNLQQVGKTVNLLSLNNVVIEDSIMGEGLYHWLEKNGVEMRQNPHTWQKFVYLFKVILVHTCFTCSNVAMLIENACKILKSIISLND